MARPREFDADVALEQAMQVFWDMGYQSASLSSLTRAMGISKSSFYEAFGSKHELYLSALEHYNATVSGRVVANFQESESTRVAISWWFEFVIDRMAGRGSLRGCLVSNAAVELAPFDPETQGRCREAMNETETALVACIDRGQKTGEIRADRKAADLARFLITCINGLRVMAKANPDRKALEGVAEIALSVLD
tara:strand:+ start:10239 stop:10820 length:582 start_codon:yes stop_codon:yes gene_type:complete